MTDHREELVALLEETRQMIRDYDDARAEGEVEDLADERDWLTRIERVLSNQLTILEGMDSS